MGRGKKYPPDMVVYILRKIESDIENGKTTEQACREVGIVELTYYRWRNEFGGLEVDQAKRLKALEQENARLKRLVAELCLDKSQLKNILAGKL
jgi:transposase-like protein